MAVLLQLVGGRPAAPCAYHTPAPPTTRLSTTPHRIETRRPLAEVHGGVLAKAGVCMMSKSLESTFKLKKVLCYMLLLGDLLQSAFGSTPKRLRSSAKWSRTVVLKRRSVPHTPWTEPSLKKVSGPASRQHTAPEHAEPNPCTSDATERHECHSSTR